MYHPTLYHILYQPTPPNLSQHGQAWELCSACEVAGVLRLNYQLLGASYADEPYMGGMAGLYKGEEKRRN